MFFVRRPTKIRTSPSPRGPPEADSQDPPEGPFVTLCAAVIKYPLKKLSGSLTVNKPKIKQESHTRCCFISRKMWQLASFEKEHRRASVYRSSAFKKALPTFHRGASWGDYHQRIVATTLTCQESPRYIYDPNLLKIFRDVHFFPSPLSIFAARRSSRHLAHFFFVRAFACHPDRREWGKNVCQCRHLDGGLPSLLENNRRWLRAGEGEKSGRDFVEMKKALNCTLWAE